MRAASVVILLLLVPDLASAGGTLPLVSVTEGSTVSGWWVEARGLSTFETRLLGALPDQVALVDPAALAGGPRVSRIYRVPQLSPQNAVNLGGLYGASRVLVGAATFRPVSVAERLGLVGVELIVRVQWLAVPSGAVLLQADLRGAGWAHTAAEARRLAEARVSTDLVDLLAGTARNLSGQIGVDRAEPYVVVRGIWDLQALRAFEKGVRGAPGVRDARLAWVADGVLAFDLNPATDEDRAFVSRVGATLAAAPPDGMTVAVTDVGLEVRRSARVDKEAQ